MEIAVPLTILYPEAIYTPDFPERELFPAETRFLRHDVTTLDAIPDEEAAATDAIMLFRVHMRASDFQRFPRLRAIVRMGVGFDRIDRKAAAAHRVTVCNVPDYCTTEVADHALALALSLRRGVLLHHEAQRRTPPAPWAPLEDPLLRRMGAQTFAVLGLGRIGTAAALRAKAFGFRTMFYDPYQPYGIDAALGLERAKTLDSLLRAADILSIHTPLTRETRGMIGAAQIALLPRGAVIVNTARGPVLDIDALVEPLQDGRIAGVGLDVVPVEPPREPLPRLIDAYRKRETWVEGRVVVTPHAAFCSPEAYRDVQKRGLEILHSVLFTDRPQNVIDPSVE